VLNKNLNVLEFSYRHGEALNDVNYALAAGAISVPKLGRIAEFSDITESEKF
jgi:hypothetical protein